MLSFVENRIESAVVRVSSIWNPTQLSDYTQCGNPVTQSRIDAGTQLEFICNPGTRGRYVSVQVMRDSSDVRLQLCEVLVDGQGPMQSNVGQIHILINYFII